jgi:uncharacterized membrane protein YfcA
MLTMIELLLISIPVGFLTAITGLGGASILIPILVTLGVPVKEAIASGMVTIIASSSRSASWYVRLKRAGRIHGKDRIREGSNERRRL